MLTRKRILQNLDRWSEAGWVTDAGAEGIRKELTARNPYLNLSNTLAILGAVLIGFAAMSFVAANWSAIPRIARVIILFSALWAAYGGAGWLFSNNYKKFGEASVLTGVGLFGANIMLIAQMFHLDGNPSDAVLIWGMGALLAGLAFRSVPSFVTALLLFGLWSSWETALMDAVHWWFLPAWAGATLGFAWLRWDKGYYLSGLVLSIWAVVACFIAAERQGFELILLCGLATLAVSLIVEKLLHLQEELAPPLRYYGSILSFVGLFGAQLNYGSNWLVRKSPDVWTLSSAMPFPVLAGITLAALVGAMAWAFARHDRKLLWLAYIGFAIEIVYIYFKTIGTLLNTSLFFLSAGLIVLALAVLAIRFHRYTSSGTGEQVTS